MDGVCVMAIGGRATLTVDYKKVESALKVIMRKVETGTKKATKAAAEEILSDSLDQVPRDTNTLAKSAYYKVTGSSKAGFTAEIGYGGNGNPINSKTGQSASEYMIVVHEDMNARHPVGKAKFLEDPVHAYQKRMAGKYAKFIRDEVGF